MGKYKFQACDGRRGRRWRLYGKAASSSLDFFSATHVVEAGTRTYQQLYEQHLLIDSEDEGNHRVLVLSGDREAAAPQLHDIARASTAACSIFRPFNCLARLAGAPASYFPEEARRIYTPTYKLIQWRLLTNFRFLSASFFCKNRYSS